MALTKVGKEGITGIDNSSDATAMTISSDEDVMIGTTDESSGAKFIVGSTDDDKRAFIQGSNQYRLGLKNGSNNHVWLGSGGADNFRVSNSSGSTLFELNSSGNIVLPSSNAGIHLGVTSATASNLLDDYEEGTFTPTLTSSSGASRAVDAQTSRYTKIGRICYISCAITTIGALSGSNTGTLRLGGLPFNYNGGVSKSVSSDVSFVNVNLPSGIVQTAMLQNSSGTSDNFFFSSTFDDSTVGELGISAFDHTSSLVVSLVYEVA